MKCQAITRNLLLCPRHVKDDGIYCPQHKSYTPEIHKERWFKRYILGDMKSNSKYVLLHPFPEWHFNAIVKPLRSREIVLTKEDIQAIPDDDRYLDVYLLLVSLGCAEPQEHCFLFTRAIKLYYDEDFCMAPPQSPRYLTKLEIEKHLIASSGPLLFDYLTRALTLRHVRETLLFTTVPSRLYTQGAKELAWFPRESFESLRTEYERTAGAHHPLTKTLVERWLPELKQLYAKEKEIQKLKMNCCKEELMMNRWHPDRVWKHLEMGIDIEDM